MRCIPSRGTLPEKCISSLLTLKHFKYNCQRNDLPGRPDFVFPRRKKVIFVNGCFWHQHKGCSRANVPQSNQDYWKSKLEGNIKRDKSNSRRLRATGWNVMTIWECETKPSNKNKLLLRIQRFLQKPKAIN